ncbi:MAG: hypothetical protein QXR45_01200 [Candidatus Bathyarchaeia archaeon]
MAEEVEVTVRLPKPLVDFLREFMSEEELNKYLNESLVDAIRADLGQECFCTDLVKRVLRKHGLNDREWMR